jgi:uncharacterized repeat protein (TIGR01451 family)
MRRVQRFGLLWLTVFGVASGAWAQTAPITSELQVQKVETVDGNTVFKPAQLSKPGDVLEYRVSYTNHSSAAVNGLVANLPIPVGTTLEDKSQLPPNAQASIDGTSFAPLPLMRRVKQADGSEQQQPVPLSEYRALRWSLGTLAPGKSEQVSARVRVNSSVPPVASVAGKPIA